MAKSTPERQALNKRLISVYFSSPQAAKAVKMLARRHDKSASKYLSDLIEKHLGLPQVPGD